MRALREQRGWTLDRLSEVSGVDVGTISALENRNSKRSQFVHLLAKALGVSVAALQGDEPIDAADPPTSHLPSTHRALLAAFEELLPEQQESALADLERRAAENRRNFEELQKKFGAGNVKPDREVAKHIKPAPPSASVGKEPVGVRTATKGARKPRKTRK